MQYIYSVHILYVYILYIFVVPGVRAAAGVHRSPGPTALQRGGLLEDGVGPERGRGRHDHQPDGERTGAFTSLEEQLAR